MLCYLAVNMAEAFENDLRKIESKEKKKQGVNSSTDWNLKRLELLDLLLCLSNLQLVQLWEPPLVEMMEDISGLFVSICYKFLENPTIARDKEVLDKLSELLGLTASKYGLTLSK